MLFLPQENELTGTLPPANWPNLIQFIISNNAFSGTLSDSIGNSTNLDLFRIGQNRLTGTLPSTIGLWTDLKVFYISGDPPLGNAFDFEVCTDDPF